MQVNPVTVVNPEHGNNYPQSSDFAPATALLKDFYRHKSDFDDYLKFTPYNLYHDETYVAAPDSEIVSLFAHPQDRINIKSSLWLHFCDKRRQAISELKASSSDSWGKIKHYPTVEKWLVLLKHCPTKSSSSSSSPSSSSPSSATASQPPPPTPTPPLVAVALPPRPQLIGTSPLDSAVKPSRYVYLATISEHFSEASSSMILQGDSADLIVLCFAAPCKINNSNVPPPRTKFITSRNSTWTTARNELLVAALLQQQQHKPGQDYEYFVFFDGDAVLKRSECQDDKKEPALGYSPALVHQNVYRMLERYLSHFRPSVGVPFYSKWFSDRLPRSRAASAPKHRGSSSPSRIDTRNTRSNIL
jgi:hypothetical protein